MYSQSHAGTHDNVAMTIYICRNEPDKFKSSIHHMGKRAQAWPGNQMWSVLGSSESYVCPLC